MDEPNKSRDVSALIALVNAMIEYWKEIGVWQRFGFMPCTA